MISRMISSTPRTRARMPAEAGGTSSPIARSANSWRPLGGAWPSRSTALLEVAGAAFGERERGVGHAPDLHPLLRARGGDRALEVAARGLGVEALGRARAEDRQRGGLVLGLRLELLVRALLERLDRLEAAALLHADLALFGGHRPAILWCGERRRGAARPRRARPLRRGRPAGMLAAWRAALRRPARSLRASACVLCRGARSRWRARARRWRSPPASGREARSANWPKAHRSAETTKRRRRPRAPLLGTAQLDTRAPAGDRAPRSCC